MRPAPFLIGLAFAALGLDLSTLAARKTRDPARLEAAGLVRRTQDEQDGRRRGLSVTDEGERVLRSVKSRRTAWLAARLAKPAQVMVT